MSTSLFQPQTWTPQEDPFSSGCFEVHPHLDDVSHLLDEPAVAAHDGTVQDRDPAPSFSLTSNAGAMSIFFMI